MNQPIKEQQKASNDAEGVFVFRHAVDCVWELTTSAQCEYRDTHHYCPHSEHACTCPEVSGELSDNPTLEEAEAYLRAQGIDPKDVANDFIEWLLRQNLGLKQQLARVTSTMANAPVPRICVMCGHEERFSDNEGGFCEKIVLAPSVAGSGLAKCRCCCQFPVLDQLKPGEM